MTREKLWRYFLVLSLGFWLGGLTFYALVVVRVGTELLGGRQQGFLTQQVTSSLNLLRVAVCGVLLVDVLLTRHRALAAAWLIMTLAQAALFALHARLDELLDGRSQAVIGVFLPLASGVSMGDRRTVVGGPGAALADRNAALGQR